ncbi:17948_t:CDS:2 [Entrophospora sp. SA101]|nr:17948_t:CDS:2 [Entrophospora sp. SA101]
MVVVARRHSSSAVYRIKITDTVTMSVMRNQIVNTMELMVDFRFR